MARWLNKAQAQLLFQRLPKQAEEMVKHALDAETKAMVDAMQRAAPVGSDLEKHPGQFRDSIHSYPNPSRKLSNRIIADARDAMGQLIGKHIEYGHLAPDGSHVPASPSFWPTYRARKKPAKARLRAAAKRAVAKAADGTPWTPK